MEKLTRKLSLVPARPLRAAALAALLPLLLLPAPILARGGSGQKQDQSKNSDQGSNLVDAMPDLKSSDSLSGEMPDPVPRAPQERQYDVAILPFRNVDGKEKSGFIYKKLQDMFRSKGFRVNPRPEVDVAVANLGVLTPDAVVDTREYQQLAVKLHTRYLVIGAQKVTKPNTQFGATGYLMSAAQVIAGPAIATPAGLAVAAGGLCASVIGGFTTTTGVEFESRLFDGVVRKVVWVGAEGAQESKTFGALWANKKSMEEKAIAKAMKKVFGDVLPHLQSPRHFDHTKRTDVD